MIKIIVFAYLIIVNVLAFSMYLIEGKSPEKRLPVFLLFVFSLLGGCFGAALANYFFDTEFREARSSLHVLLGYLPPVCCILYFILFQFVLKINVISFVWNDMYSYFGIWGRVFIIINAITFVLIIIRRTSYYVAPMGNYLIPDIILVAIILLGGATGGVIAKLLFNFKEDWSTNCRMAVPNFVYNAGMFIIFFIQIALIIGLKIYI